MSDQIAVTKLLWLLVIPYQHFLKLFSSFTSEFDEICHHKCCTCMYIPVKFCKILALYVK